jgi:hypothetical protein
VTGATVHHDLLVGDLCCCPASRVTVIGYLVVPAARRMPPRRAAPRP